MPWTWDIDKAKANRAKHGLSLETAALVFDDPFHASKPDPHPDGDRWHTIGLVGSVVLLAVHNWSEETKAQRAELKALAALRDEAIDTSDAPELIDWSGARRGLFYRPVKQQLTLRLDADVVAWFKRHTTSNEGYQTRINRALREYVQGQASRTRRSRA